MYLDFWWLDGMGGERRAVSDYVFYNQNEELGLSCGYYRTDNYPEVNHSFITDVNGGQHKWFGLLSYHIRSFL